MRIVIVGVLFTLSAATRAAEVQEVFDRHQWESMLENTTTIDFTGFPEGTLITDQYAKLGVLFTDGFDTIDFNEFLHPPDDFGLRGHGDIVVEFIEPQYGIAIDYPDAVANITLFAGEEEVFVSGNYGPPNGEISFFLGLVSTRPFDRAVLHDPGDGFLLISDLHFGVPAPGALAMLTTALLTRRSRRR